MIERLKKSIPADDVRKIDNFPRDPIDCAMLIFEIRYGNQFMPRHKILSSPMKKGIIKEYEPFITKIHEGDDVYYYSNIAVLSGSAGFVIVRDGEVIEKTYSIKS